MSQKKIVILKGKEKYSKKFEYPSAVIHGKTLYSSGTIGIGPDEANPTDPEIQMVAAFEQIKKVLETAGVGLDNILEMTTFHVEMEKHIDTFVKVKHRYIKPPFAAWTAIGVNELSWGAFVEIKVIAHLD